MSLLATLVDGLPADSIPLSDRGFQYGDGVFRTLKRVGGAIPGWDEHHARLAEDAARLSIPCPASEQWLSDIAALGDGDATLKLILTRGSGPRGYAIPAAATPRRIVQAGPAPVYPASVREGVSVAVCTLRLGLQPLLAGVKHLNRLESVLARTELMATGCFEGLLLDTEERLIEATQCNLWLIRDGVAYTPLLSRCGVAGVTRDRVRIALGQLGVTVCEADLSLDDAYRADELWLCNSLMGLARVGEMAGHAFASPALLPRVWAHDPQLLPPASAQG